MIEIGTQVDLLHPADRVWRAVTDPELLGRWFAEAEPVPGRPDRWRLRTAGLPGFDTDTDVECVDRRTPELIVVRCREGTRDSLLTCSVTPTEAGCRVLVREAVEHGDWPAGQGAGREECYRQALAGRLPALLDWLAFRQVDLRRDSAAPTAVLPAALMADVGRPPARRRRATGLGVGLGVVTLALGLTGWALSRGGPPADPGAAPVVPVPGSTATPGPTRSTATARPTPTPTPSGSVTPSRTPSATPSRRAPSPTPTATGLLDARYETVSTRLFGYTGEVVVDNPGGAPTPAWTVRVTLPRGSSAAEVSGADWRQDGQSVTFSGPAVPAGGSQVIRFDVRTADPVTKAPTGCTVDERPCAGL
ncbi:SRPBCC domain-containing protein [Micromonospora sp. WMMD714]|uniref:SRPBCC family protein n=1 Tax=Micromonospora sp. WMMD714 TaxID=3016097 RepID=UPI00249B6A6A|nr:SRPBCC domain-containing protein [Micromonospora sp. WMMD714]WFE65386.1 SRPBCC domain-containing protein [Micromonospora sp. WMMD714]